MLKICYSRRRPALFRLIRCRLIALIAGASASSIALGQAPKSNVPAPENLSFRTWDGVDIAATFYPSAIGKEAVPIIMLHQYKGSRADFHDLALAMQAAGHAVIVPDLRGHGQSTRQLVGVRERQLNVAQLNRRDIEAMAFAGPQGGGDVEVCKAFLMDKNNAGQLNIEKLCVIGAEMGATVGIRWAAADWSWPRLPTIKQGRDVKALVLISPHWSFKGVPINLALNNRDLVTQWSWLLIVGDQDAEALSQAAQVNKALERFLPAPPPNEAAEKQALFFSPLPTSLQGTKLVTAKELNIAKGVGWFIDNRLAKKPFPWTDRSRPR